MVEHGEFDEYRTGAILLFTIFYILRLSSETKRDDNHNNTVCILLLYQLKFLAVSLSLSKLTRL